MDTLYKQDPPKNLKIQQSRTCEEMTKNTPADTGLRGKIRNFLELQGVPKKNASFVQFSVFDFERGVFGGEK